MALIKGIHHVALTANGMEQYEKAIEFYRDILGVPVARTWGEGDRLAVMLDMGQGIIELFSYDGTGEVGGTMPHVAFATDDTDACIEAVRAAGYAVTMEPSDVVISGNYPARIAFCKGPVGETVEFFCVK